MATAATPRNGAPKQEGESATATDGGRPTKALPQQLFDDNVSVQNIKAYLSNFGGKAKYSDMVTFFKRSLTDPSSKARKRADFKDILSKIASFKTEDGERFILLRSPGSKCNYLQGHLPRPLSSPEQRRAHLLDRRLGSDSSASSQSSLSTCDSGIGLDSHSIAGNAAARARELGKSTDSLDDDLMSDLYDDEGVDYTVASGQSEFSEEEKKWMMYATLCDCQQLAAMMDKNPDLPSKRDFVTGFTALHWGAKLGRRDMVRLIADSGADINVRTHGGQTALHLAAMQGHDAIIKMLVTDYGADVHVRDYAGKKPKDLVKDTVAGDLQRKLGRSLILDPDYKPVVRASFHFEQDGKKSRKLSKAKQAGFLED